MWKSSNKSLKKPLKKLVNNYFINRLTYQNQNSITNYNVILFFCAIIHNDFESEDAYGKQQFN